MEFEHVTFDLPHGTFHALQGEIPVAKRRSSYTVSRTIHRPRSPSLPSSAAVDVTSLHPGFAGLPGERSVMIDGAAWIVMARNPAS